MNVWMNGQLSGQTHGWKKGGGRGGWEKVGRGKEKKWKDETVRREKWSGNGRRGRRGGGENADTIGDQGRIR